MEEMLISRIETYHKGLPALKSFIQFVNGAYTEQGEATGTAGRIPFKKMSLESISFIYPNTTRMVLKNIFRLLPSRFIARCLTDPDIIKNCLFVAIKLLKHDVL